MARIVFGVSGASGMSLASLVLGCYRHVPDLELHLVMSKAAATTLKAECGDDAEKLQNLAHLSYDVDNIAAPPASGSWEHAGMIICPCSMNTLACVANGMSHNLLQRAADVTLKERRPLILVARETPLNLIHLNNMTRVTQAGAIVMPFMPAFYTGDNSMENAMKNFAGRMLDLLKLPHPLCKRWAG